MLSDSGANLPAVVVVLLSFSDSKLVVVWSSAITDRTLILISNMPMGFSFTTRDALRQLFVFFLQNE